MDTATTDAHFELSPDSSRSSKRVSSRRILLNLLQSSPFLTLVFLALDLLVLFESYTFISTAWGAVSGHQTVGFLPTLYVLMCVVPLSFFLLDRYAPDSTPELELFHQHVFANLLAIGLSTLVLYLFVTYNFNVQPSRAVLIFTFLAFTPLSFVYRRLVANAISRQKAMDKFIVVGDGPIAEDFYKDYQRALTPQRLLFVGLDGKGKEQRTHIAGEGSPRIEHDLEEALSKVDQDHDGVIVAQPLSSLKQEFLVRLIKLRFQKIPVYTLETFSEKYWRQVPLQTMNRLWPLQSGFQLSHGSLSVHMKRIIDALLSFLGLVFLSPFLLLVAAVVCLESKGPAIFRQVRIGKDAKPFVMYKFRTMRVDSDQGDMYTRKKDSRITRIGGILRLLRIDELPQLLNVLKGDMSLIGPRAEWVKCVEIYEKSIPDYHFRHLVKPGITGWAQICYPYGENEEDTKEKLKYDLYYVRHFSTLFDFTIALKTFKVMVLGRGR